jgi:protoheme IX farnesyltransferase
VYTPLKRRSSLATLVGAVPGALPILGGWTAVAGGLHAEAWILFWILFLWQLPHFLALAWLYREDYRRAELRMMSVDDDEGRVTFLYASLYAGALIPVASAASVVGLAGGVYFAGAFALSAGFLLAALAAARRRTPEAARRLFRVSLAYLPLLLVLMAVDRVP